MAMRAYRAVSVWRDTLGKGLGYLHELPDQLSLSAALGPAFHLDRPADLPALIQQAERALTTGRGTPVHIQIPLDLMAAEAPPFTALSADAKAAPCRPLRNALARL